MIGRAKPTGEQYSLFRSYLDERHPDGGMADMSVLDYSMMVEDSHIDTVITEYRPRGIDTFITGRGEGPLLAACLTDRLADGFSLVYSFYSPERGAPFARRLRDPRSHREGATTRPAPCLSRLLGRRFEARWPIRAPISRRSGSA